MIRTIIAVVVCDDVRHESNGKDIIIGVYGSDAIVPSYPALLRPSFWVQFQDLPHTVWSGL
jgi:hypothetical protein